MATVFMKWLERKPSAYDRGIRLLTLGRIDKVKERIAMDYIHEGDRVLEIGCGTGELATRMAEKGAEVFAIDASPSMLAEAQKKIKKNSLEDRVTLQLASAALVGEIFPPRSFNRIVSTLVFSELPPDDRRYVLEACENLLAPGGRLLVADEVIPTSALKRILFNLVRFPLALITWLLTRTTTSALKNFETLLEGSGFILRTSCAYLNGGLVLYEAIPKAELADNRASRPVIVGHLSHKVSIRTLLDDLWTLFFRIIPPYPKFRPGLYTLGNPTQESPVLVTGNYSLTVRRLVKGIDSRLDAWILVVDSAGINVWCAAGGGYLTAEKVVSAVKSCHLDQVTTHQALILPQLSANGVDGWAVRNQTGWGVHWGPVRAIDLPEYLADGRRKSDDMRWVRFPLKDRLEMVTVTLGFYSLLILVPVLIFWRQNFWPVAASLVGLSYFYAVVHPWLPGRDGLVKSISLTGIALSGLFAYTLLLNPIPTPQLFNWVIGVTALSVFTAGELQGMSPIMRGEQANWGWEALVGAVLILTYWLAPFALGWR